MAATSIEWTHWQMPDGTRLRGMVWNPSTGCDQISPGCAHCYAKGIAKRFWATQYAPIVFAGSEKGGPLERPREFEDLQIHEERLTAPLTWSAPCGVFVNSMSDLFHAAIPDSFIAAVLGVIWSTRRHVHFILTKRIERVPVFLRRLDAEATQNGFEGHLGEFCCYVASRHYGADVRDENAPLDDVWPPPNLRIGPSIENQRFADQRFPVVCELGEAGWNTMVSLEPLLGPVRIPDRYLALSLRAWPIVGGESGGKARPLAIAWVRSIIQQCQTAGGVRVFVKQMGANVRDRNDAGFDGCGPRAWPVEIEERDGVEDHPNGYREEWQGDEVRVHLRDRKGGDLAEWPADLRVQEYPVERAA